MLLSGSHRQREIKCRSFLRQTFYAIGASMEGDDLSAEVQTHSHSAVGGNRLLRAVKLFKELSLVLFCDADSFVSYRYGYVVAPFLDVDVDQFMFRRILGGVGKVV